jgi:peptide/nickel transport system substrate-binding protein
VLFYERDLQAYRSDAFTGFVPQPEPDGAFLFQFGAYSYLNLRSSGGGGGSSGGSSGIPTGVWLGIGAAIIVIVGIVVLVRRRSEEDRA